MTPIRLAVIVGTRPEVIKQAPIILEGRARPEQFDVQVVSTGQHREILDAQLDWFGIKADLDLGIMSQGQSLESITASAVTGIGAYLAEHRPDWVVVQGDTTSTFVGALAAFYQQIPVVHVEAGLRTGDMYSPFPEELNRSMVGRIATLHAAPTPASRQNLLDEGVPDDRILVTGNTAIDALLWTREKLAQQHSPSREGRELLVTMHRRENLGEPMGEVSKAILQLLETHPDLTVRFPIHPNPKVRDVVRPILGDHPRVKLCEPLNYPEFVAAMEAATLILSDSGGVQEEAPTLDKPVLILRNETERAEAVDAGAAILVGTNQALIVEQSNRLLNDVEAYRQMASAHNPFGAGDAAARTLDRLAAQTRDQ